MADLYVHMKPGDPGTSARCLEAQLGIGRRGSSDDHIHFDIGCKHEGPIVLIELGLVEAIELTRRLHEVTSKLASSVEKRIKEHAGVKRKK